MALTRITRGVIKPNENYDTHNIVSTGIVTSVGLDVNGNADVSGSLSVGGVLTYEDVTSIDSVGIITARTGLVSPYADIDDFVSVGNNIHLGNAGVVTATSFVGSGAALTGIDATAIKDSGGNVKVQAQASGAMYTGIHTFSSGAEVGSNIKLGNAGVITATSFVGSGAALTGIDATAVKDSGGNVKIQAQASGAVYTGIHTFGTNTNFTDIDVDGHTNLDNVNIAGVSTFAGTLNASTVSSTAFIASGDLDVDGHTNLDNVSIAGVSTVTGTGTNGLLKVERASGAGLHIQAQSALGVFGTTSNHNLRLISNGNERILLSTNGNIGINESSPGQRLTIGGDIQIGFNTPNDAGRQLNFNVNRGSAGQTLANINWQWNSKFVAQIRGISGSDTTNKDDAHLAFFTSSANNLSERLRITSAGKVLIGTSTPQGNANADDLVVSTSGHSGITIRSGTSSNGNIFFADGTSGGDEYRGVIDYNHSSNHMSFSTNAAERLRITSAGQMVMGATTSKAKFEIKDNGYSSSTVLQRISGDDDNPYALIIANDTCNTAAASGLQFFVNNSGIHYIRARGSSTASNNNLQIVAQNDLIFNSGSSESERVRIASGGNVGINETSPDSLLHLTTNSSTAYSTSEVNTVNSTNALLRLENTNGGDGSGVNNYVGIYFRVANGANSDAQLQYVRSGDNAGTFHFKARNAGSTYPNLMTIKSDGNTGFDGVVDPKSPVHLGSNTEMRIGGQYGGLSPIMMQVEYAAAYTGTHWMFETNNMISWSFDGVLIVYGGGGSSYGSEVTKITIVYSRESGANNSGDIWRNGTTSYNIETLGHNQVGLNPSAGELTVTEDTAPDGAGSTRSLFKLGWTTAGHGGATTIWSKLHGTMYWGTGSSGDVEIQDKDGNIFWDSNP